MSPFFDFQIADVLRKGFSVPAVNGTKLFTRNRAFGLEYADDIVLLSDDAQTIQQAFGYLASEASRYGMCLEHSKCVIFLED